MSVSFYAIRAVVSLGLLFLISIVMSCQQFKYAVFSKEATATQSKQYEQSGRRGQKSWVVMYRFTDDKGENRLHGIVYPSRADVPQEKTIQVEYLSNATRVKGDVQWIWPGILVGSVVFGLIASLPLILEARDETSGRGKPLDLPKRNGPPKGMRPAKPR